MTLLWRNTHYDGEDLASPGSSPRISMAADGGRVQRTITLAEAEDYYQAVVDFLGYSHLAQKMNAGTPPKLCNYVMRAIPHSFRGFDLTPFPPPPELIPGQPPANAYVYAIPVGRSYGWFFAKSCPDLEGLSPYGRGGENQIPNALGLDPGVAYYRRNKLRLEYRTLDYDVRPDYDGLMINAGGPLVSTAANPIPDEGTLNRYVTAVVRTSKKVINLRRGIIFFEPEPGEPLPQPIPEGLPFEEDSGTLTMIWHEIPLAAVPYAAIQRCANAVNSNAFWFNRFPPGTVRFDSWDRKELFSPVGLQIVDLQYNFQIALHVDLSGTPRGWNSALRKIPGSPNVDYRPVRSYGIGGVFGTTAVPGNPPYRSADLADLFRPDQPP